MAGRSFEAKLDCIHCGARQAAHLFTKFDYELVRCTQCELVRIDNPIPLDELAASYQVDADYHNELLDPTTPHFKRMESVSQRHLDVVQKWTKPGHILDVGCSNGQFLNLARQAGYVPDGVEFSTGVADFARDHFGLNVAYGDIHAVDAPDESYDVITMFDVIEHVPEPPRDIAAALRLLKPGGTFILSTPNVDGIYPRLSLKVAKLLNYWQHPEPPHHICQFSEKTLSAMLGKAGFDIGPSHHINIDLAYSFGSWSTMLKLPNRLAYALAFAPFAKIGPWFKSGDWFYLAAIKR